MKLDSKITYLLCFFFSFNLFPQDFTIEGSVVDQDQQAIELANVSLLTLEDSNLVTGTVTNAEGLFTLTKIKSGTYKISASYLGQTSEEIIVEITNDLVVPPLQINAVTTLEGVEVFNDEPMFEQEADRYVFTIKNSSLVQGDMMEALSRTPGLLLMNDQLTFKGEGNLGIMINGKLINLPAENVMDLLKGTSATNIESIEVITNPPAKYSAEGTILINIKMNGNLIAGYNGSVNGRMEQGIFPKYNVGTDHFFKSKKTATTITYNHSNAKTWQRFNDITNFLQADGSSSVWDADQVRTGRRRTHTINLFFDHKLNEKTTLNFTTINNFTPRYDRDIVTSTLIEGDEITPFSSFRSLNDYDRDGLNSAFYLNLDHKLPKGSLIASRIHFTYFDETRDQNITNDFFNAPEDSVNEIDFSTFSNQQIRIFTAQVDYENPLDDFWDFEAGIKYAGINSESLLRQTGTEFAQNTNLLADEGLFEYDEHNYAAYSSFGFNKDDWQLRAGLRAEYTNSTGFLQGDEQAFENNYLEWFPSFSVQKKLKKNKRIKLYYYRRITRPRYNNLNPFQLFQSFNSTVEGNPRLLPATRHYLAGAYSFNKELSVELFYRYRQNQLRTLAFQENENRLTRFVHANVDRELGYGIDVILNKKMTNFWKSYTVATYYYLNNRFQDLDTQNFTFTDGWTFSFTNNNTFNILPKNNLTIDLDIRYRSAFAFGNTIEGDYGAVNLSARKTLWQGNGSIAVGVTDIFRQRVVLQTRRFFNQDNTSLVEPETPIARVSFRYRFGNTRIKNNKKSKRQQERNRL